MIGTREIIFAGIISYLTFRRAYSIFVIILAGFFLLRYAMPYGFYLFTVDSVL